MVICIIAGAHVGFVLIITGFVGILLAQGVQPAFNALEVIPFSAMHQYEFSVIPLFILMGTFISNSGIGRETYDLARNWVGHFRGGLAIATVGACGIFAACTGSSPTTAVTMGRIAYPEMKRLGYDPKLALGCVAAGGTLGILIPPSMGFILVGIFAEISIGKLFIAGIIPGILEILFYWGTIYIMCRFDPNLGPSAPATTFRQKMTSLSLMWPVLVLVLIVLGGIYGGVFTPTEAGGIGAFGAFLVTLGRKKLTFPLLHKTLLDTALLAAVVALMLIGAFVFNNFLAITRITYLISEFLVSLEISRYLILLFILIFYIINGIDFIVFLYIYYIFIIVILIVKINIF